jgi:hypothetical protein
MCLKNPGFLRKFKQARMDAARQKIMDDGFEFVKVPLEESRTRISRRRG